MGKQQRTATQRCNFNIGACSPSVHDLYFNE